MKHGPIVVAYALLLLSILLAAPARPAPALPSSVSPIDVGDRPQLFIDRLFAERASDVILRVEKPRKTGDICLRRERPWESATLNWFTVLQDGDRMRMWYECYDIEGWPTADDTSFCYAESTDGVKWTRPDLGMFTYQGSAHTNILFRQIGEGAGRSRVHGAGVFKDPHAAPEERYKAVSQGIYSDRTPPYKISGMVSPDGLHWTRLKQPICDMFGDSQYSGLWDDRTGRYMLYGRVNGRGRALGWAESSDFGRFPALQLMLQTDELDPPDTDLYNPAVTRYTLADGVYFAFPSLYEHRTHTLDIRLAVSRDGIHWTWPERSPYIPLGVRGAFDSGSLYMGHGLVQKGDDIYLYYSGSILNHQQVDFPMLLTTAGERIFSRVVTRRDRFVCAAAETRDGWLVTPAIRFTGSQLELNLRTHPKGMARVEMLDAQGHPIPGFSLRECIPVQGDHLRAVVRWRKGSNVAAHAGRTVRLKIALREARLYAFRFRR